MSALHFAGEAVSSDISREEILRDGTSIRIRAIRPDDRERLLEHFRSLSREAVYFRFFGPKTRLSEDELDFFTNVDFVHHVGLVATLTGDRERFVGVARYIVGDPEKNPRRAEVAFAVLDGHQGRGVGTLLLEHLARVAQANGIDEFEADVLGDNRRMLEVFLRSGFVVRRKVEAGVVHVCFPTGETEEFVRASTTRERTAAAESVRRILAPRSVAVVGASRREGSIGAAILENLKATGFTGTIHPVNPNAREIAGLRCSSSIGAIGEPVDVAVIVVPAASVEAAVRDCAHAGVRGLVVISAGFAETGPKGRKLQETIKRIARDAGMRLVGPNCMGVLNTDPEVRLNATFSPHWPPEGGVGMLTQSGALGLAILDYAGKLNLGISTFVSVGNKADVSGNDLLAYWAEDPRTRVIVLYLESFGNPRKFAHLAPEVARVKPIVAVKSGRSASGTRAAASHSAALASLDVAVDALFEQAGVIRTSTLEELFDVASLFASQPAPAGPRVGIVTNAGGPGILLADACEARGLVVPELGAETTRRLRELLPAGAGVTNPVDMIASAGPDAYVRAIELVGNDPMIDSVVAIYTPPLVTRPDEIARAIAEGAGRVPDGKPVLTVFLSSKGSPAELGSGPRAAIPSYSFPENAAMALAAANRWGRWRERPRGKVATLPPAAEERIREIVESSLGEAEESVWLPGSAVEAILREAGIPFAESKTVAPVDAVVTAELLGYPLVVKASWPGVVHKSDQGGVICGLGSAAEVNAAIGELLRRSESAGLRLEQVMLQREIRGGVEALVGVTSDPTFGPLLVCGLGGTLVELLGDVSFRLTPVSDVDAREMIDRIRARKLLDGYRGSPPADREELESLVRLVSALVEIVPELHEMDLNPVKVLPKGEGIVVVDARMRIGPRPAHSRR